MVLKDLGACGQNAMAEESGNFRAAVETSSDHDQLLTEVNQIPQARCAGPHASVPSLHIWRLVDLGVSREIQRRVDLESAQDTEIIGSISTSFF